MSVLRGVLGRARSAVGRLRSTLAPGASVAAAAAQRASAAVAPYEPLASLPGPLNRILDPAALVAYEPAIAYMTAHLPDLIARKIPRANVQQAFVLDTVTRLARGCEAPSLLGIGSYEDTAAAALVLSGFAVDEIDPILNYDVGTYMTKPSCRRAGYDFVFATSVIEHVQDDEQFIKDIEALLKPGGVAVLTCDFNDEYRAGDRIPVEDRRLYTRRDFTDRLLPLVPGCALVDEPSWACAEPDFVYGNCRYTFATFVFRKLQRT